MSEANFESFRKELSRLVEVFGKNIAAYKSPGYDEASLRKEFLDPFFRALGWDIENKAGLIPAHREVIVESRTGFGRADYLFRPDRKARFVCEGKKPAEELPPHARQAKGYAWTIGIRMAMLSDFEETNIYVVTGNPEKGKTDDGLIRHYHYTEYVAKARELWDLLARDNVAGGSVERLIELLPKKLRPIRTKDFDEEFLAFLDGHRRALASDLIRHNDRADLLEGTKLNEAVQCILDRLLFIRISEARGIDMGTKLHSLLETWERRQKKDGQPSPLHEEPPAGWSGAGLGAPRGSLWNSIVRHIRALDRRPPSHVPFFNGNLFKQHFSEELAVGDVWLSEFLNAISEEKSSYKFGYVAVEILGTIYERFLGKIVRPHGRGAVIEEKPEVRKAGGVYYTPRYIVEYVVEQTVGKMLDGKKPEETLKLRFLDPACGSGSFLLRGFERVCEHWQQWLTDHPEKRKKDWCWVEQETNTVHLTARLKRRILREMVYGVDLDPQAVEVTQLSLYLKMLEGETTATLEREQDLFGGDEPILPPLQDNIKCGNSIIASDFSMIPEDLVRVKAFDWSVQFPAIMKAGGFDAVMGNPPWGQKAVDFSDDVKRYFRNNYAVGRGILDLFKIFCERSLNLTKLGGRWGMVLPDIILLKDYPETRRFILEHSAISDIAYSGMAFEQVDLDTVCLVCERNEQKAGTDNLVSIIRDLTPARAAKTGEPDIRLAQAVFRRLKDFKFNIHLDAPRLALLEKLEWLPKLGDFFEAHEGIHSGNVRAKLFLDEQTNKQCEKLIFGRDEVGRYFLQWGGKWVNYHGRAFNKAHGEYANLGHAEYFERPKVFVRRTGDFVMAVADEQGLYASNNLFVVLPRGGESVMTLRALNGLLNSKFITWYFRAIQPRVGKVFAELKINQLHQFPLPPVAEHKAVSKKLSPLVDKLLGLMPKLRAAKPDSEKATLQNAVTATDQQIDALVYELYGLTAAEIKLVEAGEK